MPKDNNQPLTESLPSHPATLDDVLGSRIHLSLSHLHYDGSRAGLHELFGVATKVGVSGVIVTITDPKEDILVRPDVRVFNKSSDGYRVYACSIGLYRRTNLVECSYLEERPKRRSFLARLLTRSKEQVEKVVIPKTDRPSSPDLHGS